MNFRMGVLAAIFAALAVPANAVPFTYEVDRGSGDGNATVSFPTPGSAVVQLSGSNEAPTFQDPGYGERIDTIVWLTYTGLSPFTLVANWTYSTLDEFLAGEFFGYFPERNLDDFIDLTNSAGQPSSGQLSLALTTGTTFGFYIHTVDNCCGRASATITMENIPFVPAPSPVPLPATAALMLPALGAFGFLRRRAKARS